MSGLQMSFVLFPLNKLYVYCIPTLTLVQLVSLAIFVCRGDRCGALLHKAKETVPATAV